MKRWRSAAPSLGGCGSGHGICPTGRRSGPPSSQGMWGSMFWRCRRPTSPCCRWRGRIRQLGLWDFTSIMVVQCGPWGSRTTASLAGWLVTSSGVSVSPVPPSGAAWRMLHAVRRLHVVRLPPRPGLPHGLLLVSLYAPLSTQPVDRTQFDAALLEFTHALDMQTPTLLLGDFNGSIIAYKPLRLVLVILPDQLQVHYLPGLSLVT